MPRARSRNLPPLLSDPTFKPHAPKAQRLRPGHFVRELGFYNERPAGLYDYLLICTVAGSGRFTHRGGVFDTQAVDVVLIEPDVAHRYKTNPQVKHWELLWAHFQPAPTWRAWLDWPEVAPGQVSGLRHLALTPTVGRMVQAALVEVNELYESLSPHSLTLAINALESAILRIDEHNPRGAGALGAGSRGPAIDPRVRRAVDFIHRQFDQPLTLGDIAAAAGLSASRLSHLFRATLHQTPQQYLQRQRLARAQQLLESTQMRVGEIAEVVGYPSAFYFTNRFTRALGHSPRAYRQLLAQQDRVPQR